VGSVEEFQGQERSVIIILTVRSHLGVDVDPENKSTIGFLSNPKRFNVAVTRAKSLLIVVGDPAMLKQDPCWLELLHHAKENAAYKGVDWADREPEGDEDNSEEENDGEKSEEQSDSTDDDTSEYDFAEAAEETPLQRKD
jgi:helicase MOV-10